MDTFGGAFLGCSGAWDGRRRLERRREIGNNSPVAGEGTHSANIHITPPPSAAEQNNLLNSSATEDFTTCPLTYRHSVYHSQSPPSMWASNTTQDFFSSSRLPIENLAGTLRSSSLSPASMANPSDATKSTKANSLTSSRWAPASENANPRGATTGSSIPPVRVRPRVSSLAINQVSMNSMASSQAAAVKAPTSLGFIAEDSGMTISSGPPKTITASRLNSQVSSRYPEKTLSTADQAFDPPKGPSFNPPKGPSFNPPLNPSNGPSSPSTRVTNSANTALVRESLVIIKENVSLAVEPPAATGSDMPQTQYPVQALSTSQNNTVTLNASQDSNGLPEGTRAYKPAQPLYTSRYAPRNSEAHHPPSRDTKEAREHRQAKLKDVFERHTYAASLAARVSQPQTLESSKSAKLIDIDDEESVAEGSVAPTTAPAVKNLSRFKERALSPDNGVAHSLAVKQMKPNNDVEDTTKTVTNGSSLLPRVSPTFSIPTKTSISEQKLKAERESLNNLAGSDKAIGEITPIMKSLSIEDSEPAKGSIDQQSKVINTTPKPSLLEQKSSAIQKPSIRSASISNSLASNANLTAARSTAQSTTIESKGSSTTQLNTATAAPTSAPTATNIQTLSYSKPQPKTASYVSVPPVKPSVTSGAFSSVVEARDAMIQSPKIAITLDVNPPTRPVVAVTDKGVVEGVKPATTAAKVLPPIPDKKEQEYLDVLPVPGYQTCKRRVVLENLPEDCSLEQISEVVFGGVVEEISWKPGNAHCEVLFLSPDSAKHFYEETANDIPWPSDPDRYISVNLSKTEDQYGELHRKLAANGATRTLLAINFNPKATKKYWERFAKEGGRVVQSVREGSIVDDNGEKHRMIDIRFAGIKDAVKFWTEMDLNPQLLGTHMAFSHDPCAYSKRG